MDKSTDQPLRIAFFVVVFALLLVPATFAASITNGSFEAVQIGAPFKSFNPADIPGWTQSGTVGDGLLWAIGYSDCCGSITTAGQGNQFVTLGGGFNTPGTSNWQTTITGLTPGATYNLGFMTATEQGANFPAPIFPQVMTVGFVSGSSTPSETVVSPISTTDYWRVWVNQNYTFVANAPNAVVEFSVSNQADDMGLDNVTISPATVPEPSSMLLFGTGLLGLGMTWRRRRLSHM